MKRLLAPIVTLLATALWCAWGTLIQSAHSQPARYPIRAITLVVPFDAGGNADVVARLVGDEMAKSLGHRIVVDNKPGAGGLIGAGVVANAQPDGHTIMLNSNVLPTNFALNANSKLDFAKHFDAIGQISSNYSLLLVPASSPFATLSQFIAHAKSNPGKLNYASTGVASGSHLAFELIKSMTGIDIVHVPYKGASLAIIDLVSGRVDALLLNPSTAMPLIKSSKARGLGVAAKLRTPLTGDLPPIAETIPGFEHNNWLGLAGPRGLPTAVIQRLSSALRSALENPAFAGRMVAIGAIPRSSTPDESQQISLREADVWRDIAAKAGITIQ